MREVPNDNLQLGDGTKPSYRFRLRLSREHAVLVRCSWCTMGIVEAEVDPVSGKPFMQDGRPCAISGHNSRKARRNDRLMA
jgi:hypothetical protein